MTIIYVIRYYTSYYHIMQYMNTVHEIRIICYVISIDIDDIEMLMSAFDKTFLLTANLK